jgi:small subunit ribosomal protein S16
MEKRTQRDGRILEELGTYDPMVPETDARAKLDGERIKYWLSVGAQPSQNVKVLIKKYGSQGTHLTEQRLALARLAELRRRPAPPQPQAKGAAAAAPQDVAEEITEASDDAGQSPAAEPSE